MRKTPLLLAVLIVMFSTPVLLPAFLPSAGAQAPAAPASAAPGAGHGFLIDKHLAAGLNCASCHQESPPSKPVEMATCFKCHGSYDQLADKTDLGQVNPHASHQGALPCESCHRVHSASVNFCAQCHSFDFKVP